MIKTSQRFSKMLVESFTHGNPKSLSSAHASAKATEIHGLKIF